MPVCQVSIIPLGTGTPSVSAYVARCVKVLDEFSDLKYQLTPMSTVIEGDLPRLLEAIRKMHEVPFESGALRVVTTITIDDRRDKELTIQGKLNAVEEKTKR